MSTLDDLARRVRSLSPAWLARLRTGVTLVVLTLVVLVAVRVGFGQVSEPFPESQDAAICTDVPVPAGDPVRTANVTISVINAGGSNGLAGRTLGDLEDRGFGRGQLADAPEGTPRVANAQIWTTEGNTAAVKLVRSYLPGPVRIVDRQGPSAGITVVVGQDFEEIQDGRRQFRAGDGESTCVPAVAPQTPGAEGSGAG